MDLEQVAFNIILHAGNARSYYFEALKLAREGDFFKAKDLVTKAKQELIEAHHRQSVLLEQEANGQKTELSLLLIHAQDHLMNTILAQDLIQEMILLYEDQAKNNVNRGKDTEAI
jgi:cellobiose PTS system EIIA component